MKEDTFFESSRLGLRSNLRHRIFTDMKSYELSFEQLSDLIDNKVTPKQLDDFVQGRNPNIKGLFLMEICTKLGISISSIPKGYFESAYESRSELDIIKSLYDTSKGVDYEIDMYIRKMNNVNMIKTTPDLLNGNTIIIGGPGTGKTYLTMEIIKDLIKINNLKMLVMDYDEEYRAFTKEVGANQIEFKIGDELPESNNGLTVLFPIKDKSYEFYEHLSKYAQNELEKILKHAQDNNVDLLFLGANAISYFFLDNSDKYQEYLEKVKVVVQTHALGFCADVNLDKFMNIIVFASHDVYTTDLLKKTFEIDVTKLNYQKRGEYQVLK